MVYYLCAYRSFSFIYLFFQVTSNYQPAFLASLLEIKFITLFFVVTFRNVNKLLELSLKSKTLAT